LAVLLAGCGAVEVPVERHYRLAPPAPARGVPAFDGALRVEPLRLAAPLACEHLLRADGPVRVEAYPLHRWAGPLDQMLTEHVVAFLRRSGACAEVKQELDPGDEAWTLAGTVHEFWHVQDRGRSVGRAAFHLELRAGAERQLCLAADLAAEVHAADASPAAAVAALSAAASDVIAEFLARSRQATARLRPGDAAAPR
jgi:uncharacterized lipoprotein YmbA